MKDLYSENYKTLQKASKDTINGKTFHVHGSENQVVKMSTLPKAMYQIRCNSCQRSNGPFCRNGESNPQVHMDL